MSFSYNPADLDTTTSSGRLNTVRLLVGDTDTSDQQIQDEEIFFALSEHSDNVYSAAAFACRFIAAKYARLVTTQLDGALQSNYSDLQKHYAALEASIKALDRESNGGKLGVYAGGISIADMAAVDSNPDRVKPAFSIGQFDYYQDEPYEPWGY